jgi:NADH:ubiquinone oxidoreductase subunit 6 (subunit J)
MHTAVLYTFYILCALSAVSILFVRNVFKAALLLLVCLLSVAAIYVFTYAEFLAVAQILIYAGGIVIVIIFGIMLTTRMAGTPLRVDNTNIFGGIVASLSLLAVLLISFKSSFQFSINDPVEQNTISATGIQLMTTYILPFELGGILLLIALIGAAIVSTSKSIKP